MPNKKAITNLTNKELATMLDDVHAVWCDSVNVVYTYAYTRSDTFNDCIKLANDSDARKFRECDSLINQLQNEARKRLGNTLPRVLYPSSLRG